MSKSEAKSAIARTIATTTHGRYLVEPVAGAPILAGFHGYAESAEIQMDRLRATPGAGRWTLVSIQGLHRFYERRTDSVIASWMTRQDRELAMADNRAYVGNAIDAEWRAHRGERGVVFAGFSQGVAMAFRAACASGKPVLGVIAVGGDVPPELERDDLERLGFVLLMRGARDQWYSTETFARDQARLRSSRVHVNAIEFDGGHEWSAPAVEAAAHFLNERHR